MIWPIFTLIQVKVQANREEIFTHDKIAYTLQGDMKLHPRIQIWTVTMLNLHIITLCF